MHSNENGRMVRFRLHSNGMQLLRSDEGFKNEICMVGEVTIRHTIMHLCVARNLAVATPIVVAFGEDINGLVWW